MSLLDGTTERTSLVGFGNWCLSHLFSNCGSISDASAVIMPDKLTQNCFNSMFIKSGLVVAPELPAANLNQSCSSCYANMFDQATKLTIPPSILPSLTWTATCYYFMFRKCPFVKAPHISAQTPASGYVANAMDGMFRECPNLLDVSVGFLSWPSAVYWLYKAKSGGVFRCPSALGTNETIERGTSRCPTNWTVVNI